MDSFYVNLFSNVGGSVHSKENPIAVFTTHLSSAIKVEEDFEVALSEISFTNSWYNLNKPGLILFADNQGGNLLTSVVLPGRYKNKKSLVDACNNAIKDYNQSGYDHNNVVIGVNSPLVRGPIPYLREDPVTGIVSDARSSAARAAGPPCFNVYYDDQLRGLLGSLISPPIKEIADSQAMKEMSLWSGARNNDIGVKSIKEIDSKAPTQDNFSEHGDLTGGLRSILVYTDIVKFSHVGDKQAPLLKVVHISSNSAYEEQIHCAFESPEYRPLLNRSIQQIRIALYDDAGSVIPFRFGRVRCTLHFRPKHGFR